MPKNKEQKQFRLLIRQPNKENVRICTVTEVNDQCFGYDINTRLRLKIKDGTLI